GTYSIEDALFALPSIWCGCVAAENEPRETNLSVSVSFDKPVVFYEDAYTNAPGDVVAKRSTRTTLSISACGGASGGVLSVSARNLGKLVRVGGNAVSIPYEAVVPSNATVSLSVEYEASAHSASMDDISVAATIVPLDGGNVASDSDTATAVKLEFTPNYLIDTFIHRHKVGVRESARFFWQPQSIAVICEAGAGKLTNQENGVWNYTAPLTANEFSSLTAIYRGIEYQFALNVVEPQSVVAKSADAFDYGVPKNIAGGAGMELELLLLPTNVSFMGIAVQEVPSDYKDPQGYFANGYFDFAWSHTTNRSAGVWHIIQARNLFMYDYAEMGDALPRMTPSGEITDDWAHGWIAGSMNWMIPVGWKGPEAVNANEPVKQACVYWQRFRISPDGVLEVEKLGYVVQRNTNSVIRLNGEIVPLRPRE
ncbi:MAG: hypothetical protein II649_04140, partial [Kiritimatiellae bacterium]|nr:hypothetical protein [Kiritimatiellia bacterium]